MNRPCHSGKRVRFIAVVLMVMALIGLPAYIPSALAWPTDLVPDQPGFEHGKVLNGAAARETSPVLADINHDGRQEIIVCSFDGIVFALSTGGQLLWQTNAAALLSAASYLPGLASIESTPAVADLDQDGELEIVVALIQETTVRSGRNGGVVVLDHNGVVKPGWPVESDDFDQDGYGEGMFSSPAVGDLDGDGKLEIVVAGIDMRLHAWHYDGTIVDGWPHFLAETQFASPVIADINNDGEAEVILGTTAQEAPYAGTHLGGYMLALSGNGAVLPGFPVFVPQSIESSPAVGDINGDGRLEIVAGTGTLIPDGIKAVYAWDNTGHVVPGWPAATGGAILSSPALADLDGDGLPEVIVGCQDGKLYVFEGNGTLAPGWPVQMEDNFGNAGPLSQHQWSSPLVANFDADSQPEILMNHWCDILVFKRDGTYLTHRGANPDGKPTMWLGNLGDADGQWCPLNTPAAGDIDNDGKLEIVRTGGDKDYDIKGSLLVRVWKRPVSQVILPWPMWRRNSAHEARLDPATSNARVLGAQIPEVLQSGLTYTGAITLQNTGTTTWTAARFALASAGSPLAVEAVIGLNPGESVAPGASRTFAVHLFAAAGVSDYFTTRWRMRIDGATWFGLGVTRQIKVGSEPAFQVLYAKGPTADGNVYAVGLALPLTRPTNPWDWSYVESLGFTSRSPWQYFVLDRFGGIMCGGHGSCFGGTWQWDASSPYQQILVGDHGATYYLLDKWGRLFNSVGAYSIRPAPPVLAGPTVVAAALTPNGKGVYVLDAYGQIYTGGTARPFARQTPRFSTPIARTIKLTADGSGYYVLDIHGRVYSGGSAVDIQPNYEISDSDWARDFALGADGSGYYLLGRDGEIYTGGNAPRPSKNLPPVFSGQDVARELVLADSRVPRGLSVQPQNLTVLIERGDQELRVGAVNNLGAQVNWRVIPAPDQWLGVLPLSGQGSTELKFSIDSSKISVQNAETAIEIQSSEAGVNSVRVPISVHIVDHVYQVYLPHVSR